MVNNVSKVSDGKQVYTATLTKRSNNMYQKLIEVEKAKESLFDKAIELNTQNVPTDKDSPIYKAHVAKKQKIMDIEKELDIKKAAYETEIERVNYELSKFGSNPISKEIDEIANVGTNLSEESPILKARDAKIEKLFGQ